MLQAAHQEGQVASEVDRANIPLEEGDSVSNRTGIVTLHGYRGHISALHSLFIYTFLHGTSPHNLNIVNEPCDSTITLQLQRGMVSIIPLWAFSVMFGPQKDSRSSRSW